jgi:hypothetical protein
MSLGLHQGIILLLVLSYFVGFHFSWPATNGDAAAHFLRNLIPEISAHLSWYLRNNRFARDRIEPAIRSLLARHPTMEQLKFRAKSATRTGTIT